MSRPVKLYIDWLSQPSRAVLALARLAGVNHEVNEIRLSKGMNKTEEYQLIHPQQQVPAMYDPN